MHVGKIACWEVPMLACTVSMFTKHAKSEHVSTFYEKMDIPGTSVSPANPLWGFDLTA
jgi:hypothetical protein